MQDASLMATAPDILVLLDGNHAEGIHEPAGSMWFPPEFYEYFTLEQ